jgi:hypothetical protein
LNCGRSPRFWSYKTLGHRINHPERRTPVSHVGNTGSIERFIAGEEKEASDRIDEIRSKLVDETAESVFALKQNQKALYAWTKKNEKSWVSRALQLVFGKVWIKKSPPKIVLNLEEETVVARLRAQYAQLHLDQGEVNVNRQERLF